MRQRTPASLFALAFAASFGLCAAPGVWAWEWAYGQNPDSEQSGRRVAPVVFCPGGGYIAIGSRQILGLADAYVVRTNNAGAPIWEAHYDIQGSGAADQGMALVELPPATPGFVLLSNTTAAGVSMPALTRIDCAGNIVWSRIYPDALGYNLRGFDLILARTGDPMYLTAPGDLIIAGDSWNGVNYDAYLLRTTAAGIQIWNWAYANTTTAGTAGGQFNALTEAAPWGTRLTGDLVAVGRYLDQTTGNRQGLVARVDGDTGVIGGGLQCMAHHGGPDQELYYSVVELGTPPFAGQFAMVGTDTNFGVWRDDVWVTRGTPCIQVAQVRLGQSGGILSTEIAYDLREVVAPMGGGAVVGDLAITGYRGPSGGGTRDAFLLLVQPATLAPVFGNLFGDHGPDNEVGTSLAQIPAGGAPGFILAGATQTDWSGLGDPSDLYLVKTDNAGHSGCDIPWLPTAVSLSAGSFGLTPTLRNPAQSFPIPTTVSAVVGPLSVCP